MKYTLPLLSLLAVTSTFSFSLENHTIKRNYENFLSTLNINNNNNNNNGKELKDKIKKEIEEYFNTTTTTTTTNTNTNTNNIIVNGLPKSLKSLNITDEKSGFDECKKIVNEYYRCLPKEFKSNNYDESCNTFNSEQCQTLFNTKLSSFHSCKEVSNNFQDMVDYAAGIMNIHCAKDEHGEYCPISTFSQTAKEGDKLTDDILRENCKSKICREKTMNGITAMKNMSINIFSVMESFKINKMKRNFDDKARADEMLTILNDETCSSQANANS